MNFIYIYVCFMLLFCTGLSGQQNTSVEKLQSKVDEVLSSSGMDHASLGVSVYNTKTNKLVYGHQPDMMLTPASTQKIVCTGAALGILGEDFRFETILEMDGELSEEGVLDGNIYLRGGGDPTLGYERFSGGVGRKAQLQIWTDAIKAAGISRVNGCIVGDDSFYDTQSVPSKWVWEDMGNYYGAGASALNFHENQYNIQFRTGVSEGASTDIIRVNPPMSQITFLNEVKTGATGSGDQAYVFAAPYSNYATVRGTVPPGGKEFTIKAAVPDPSLFAATQLEMALENSGVSVDQSSTTARLILIEGETQFTACEKRNLLHTQSSVPLSEIVFWANKKSINLYCETLLKMIACKVHDQANTTYGLKAVKDYWANRGINLNAFNLQDGSGLSPVNAISTRNFCKVLSAIKKEDYYETFNNSLSVAGDPNDKGGMRSMLRNTPAELNLRAKSGYIGGVRSYSGYVDIEAAELAFSIIVNHYHCSNSAARVKLTSIMEGISRLEL